jgi:hypothetical protein
MINRAQSSAQSIGTGTGTGTVDIDLNYYNCNNRVVSEQFMYDVYIKVNEYNKATYALYDEKTLTKVREWFRNPAFHVFEFKSGISCFFRLDTKHKESKKLIRNGYMYVNTHVQGWHLIQKIAEYCKKNDIFDMITIVDPFGLSVEEYMNIGFLKGTGFLNYYYYNVQIPKLLPKECGFVTI